MEMMYTDRFVKNWLYGKIAQSNPFDVITLAKQAEDLNKIAYMIRYRKALKYYRSIWYKMIKLIKGL